MKMMGMKGWVNWASWYCKFSIFMIISVGIMTTVLHFSLFDLAILPNGEWSVTFVFLLLYGLALMTLCFAISAFFSTGMITHVR